jgi:NADPH:quinone reductase-like Zn-dependent oxidoreductase
MVRVQRSTVVNAPLDAVWQVVRDFNGHDRWHPAVTTSALEAGRLTDQVGAVRRFRLTGGEQVREKLLSLSDRDHSFRYTIVDADVPLENYVAEVALRPVTDGNRTYWSWQSRFDTPPGQESALARLVAEGVYEAGFEAVRARVEPQDGTPPDRAAESGDVASAGSLETRAMVVNHYGDPGVFRSAILHAPRPARGQVRIRQRAIGVNFIDVYCRSGYFRLLDPPGVPGMEAAGEVIDVGEGVNHLSPGQRVGYACPPVGAYAEIRTMGADLVVPLPDNIDDITAAGGLLKGLTAEFLLHRVHQVKPGDTVLVFAPAGGVGSLLCQWANHLGATVIGATSTEDKARRAREFGAHHVILPGPVSLAGQVRELTGGRGADVIYDAVGRDTFDHSQSALANCGHLVSYGQASGDIGERNISAMAVNSATLSRPNYGHYTDTREKLAAGTTRLFDAIAKGFVRIHVNYKFPLSAAADAHRALEGRATTGSIVLVPDK